MQQKDSSCPGIMHHLWLFQHPLNLYRILSSSSLVRLGPPRPPQKDYGLFVLSLSVPPLLASLKSGEWSRYNAKLINVAVDMIRRSAFYILMSVDCDF